MPNLKMNEDETLHYLDNAITKWREWRKLGEYDDHTCACYIDAFQSVRYSLFGELLPKEEESCQ